MSLYAQMQPNRFNAALFDAGGGRLLCMLNRTYILCNFLSLKLC